MASFRGSTLETRMRKLSSKIDLLFVWWRTVVFNPHLEYFGFPGHYNASSGHQGQGLQFGKALIISNYETCVVTNN